MNREQKCKQTQKLKAEGFSMNQINAFFRYKQMEESNETIPEGTKVKLDLDRIKSHLGYKGLTEKYRNWVETNVDKVFTVEYDKGKKVNPVTVCLKEDESQPKWLFWVGDLEVVKDDGE